MSGQPADVLRAFLAGERVIAFHPSLARIGGSINAGIFLSQLIYWTSRSHSSEGWVYKTKAEWQEETGLGRHEIDTVRNKLRDKFLVEESQPQGTDRTISYRVDWDVVAAILLAQEALVASAGTPGFQVPDSGAWKARNQALVLLNREYNIDDDIEIRVPMHAAVLPELKPEKPKRKGTNLQPLVDAFRQYQLPDPKFLGGEARAAGTLVEAYGAKPVAQCWKDHLDGTYGGEWERERLSFAILAGNNRMGNWERWNAAGRRRQEVNRGGNRAPGSTGSRGRRTGVVDGTPPPGERSYDDRPDLGF